ncbi:unnamed protein product [marine sediment metagenome]|uniref:Uncharacterized protein n=1 Tax=marine sediment metagenome TaxID=412755 RepID=X1J8V5_9ZZZZ
MDRRIETRVVEGTGVGLTTLIQRDACDVWWITVSPKTVGSVTDVEIYDGFDRGGNQKWHAHPAYTRQHNFIPPIPCDQALTVYCGGDTKCYTIGYSVRKWRKEVA